jgi:DNA recombination protein RmuC
MDLYLAAAALVLGLANLTLVIALFRRKPVTDPAPLRPFFDALSGENQRLDQIVREEFARNREETARGSAGLREELSNRLTSGFESLLSRHAENQRSLEARLQGFRDVTEKVADTVAQQLEKTRQTVDQKLHELQTRNEQRLEEMRRTVDEKLTGTLEKRLGESFKLVSERLEAVHKGLGEMQVMATSVGDLKRVLTNVKARGTWGEIQLGSLLEQILSPEQFAANVAPRPGSSERVEFAIRLPGPAEGEAPVWLPVDAKFPQEDYLRLVEATDRADMEGVAEASRALESRLRRQAREIADKYIEPPHTTDFALLFLPSESLYAEVLRRPGLASSLQQDHRIVIAGPTTLGALLNSLQMGFRTLAIQRRSSEVWTVLSAVKTEFGRFGDVLANVKSKLDQASKQIEQTEVRTRAINRKLREVEELPAAEAARLLPSISAVDEQVTEEECGILPFARRNAADK